MERDDTFKSTITLADAARITGPILFNLMIKPYGSLCNLDCRYCYYLDKSRLYGGHEPVMSEELLERAIRDYLSTCETPEVTFNWHGGEPLMAGLDFYRKAVALEKKYADGKIVHNTLQTNGTLITPEWADFFAEENFLIGLSIDRKPLHSVSSCRRKDKVSGQCQWTSDEELASVNGSSCHRQ